MEDREIMQATPSAVARNKKNAIQEFYTVSECDRYIHALIMIQLCTSKIIHFGFNSPRTTATITVLACLTATIKFRLTDDSSRRATATASILIQITALQNGENIDLDRVADELLGVQSRTGLIAFCVVGVRIIIALEIAI